MKESIEIYWHNSPRRKYDSHIRNEILIATRQILREYGIEIRVKIYRSEKIQIPPPTKEEKQ